MDPREELDALRRMAELEAKAGATQPEHGSPEARHALWEEAKTKSAQNQKDKIAGLVRGAGSIGATLLWPYDAAKDAITGDADRKVSDLVTGRKPKTSNELRREGMDQGLRELGADTSSTLFQAWKLGGEVAGTAGVGGLLGNAARGVGNVLGRLGIGGVSPEIVTALTTGGMRTGAAPTNLIGAGKVIAAGKDLALRAGAGATVGGASAGLIDPGQAGAGALVGGGLPIVGKAAGSAGNMIGTALSSVPQRLMQSAVKPTIEQLRKGESATAVQTLLDYGINPTKGGVEKLRTLIGDKNDEIANLIGGSSATVDKGNVLNALRDVRQKFGNQVSPTSDLGAIQRVADDFTAHPNLPNSAIPVQAAQEMKQGTYRVLKGKYGQLGSAETEAQKALARGLKEEIATAVPGVAPLNAEESRLLTTLSVAERRALMDMNKNPMGLAALANNPVSWAAFMADKSALFKSLAARALNSVPKVTNPLLSNPAAAQLGYRVAPVALTGQ